MRALVRYRGPLLVDSEIDRIVAVRDELQAAVRRAALDGSAEALWARLDTEHGREDPAAMQLFLRTAHADNPRRAVIASRLHALWRT